MKNDERDKRMLLVHGNGGNGGTERQEQDRKKEPRKRQTITRAGKSRWNMEHGSAYQVRTVSFPLARKGIYSFHFHYGPAS